LFHYRKLRRQERAKCFEVALFYAEKGEIMSNYLFISDAAKEVNVESHVLRYWEEELHLPIKRNELGHRYYTKEDVERFKTIKGMKERGLQLKAIKMILKDGKLDLLPTQTGDAAKAADRGRKPGETVEETGEQKESGQQEENTEKQTNNGTGSEEQAGVQIPQQLSVDVVKDQENMVSSESKEEKSKRLQWLLQQLIRETLQENNGEICREIRESVVKELDYQFRMQEERDELRDKMMQERDEEHYKKMDELLRKKTRKGFHLSKKKKGT